ncbi:MAG: cupin domain-containing protein [Gemmatimonadota bacterium]
MHDTEYHIHMDEGFEPLQRIDVQELVAACDVDWFNQTLTRVNDCLVRLGILKGEFHWHKHDEEDEFFFVVDGELLIDVGEETFVLGPKQGFTVPKGVVHRTRAPGGTVVLMVEGAGVVPTGDG